MEDYAWLCINACTGDACNWADPDRGRPLGHVRGRAQMIRFGVASGDRLGNQVAKHIGGSWRACEQDSGRSP